MSNNFGIPEEVEERLRHRDKICVYCHKEMMHPCVGDDRRNWATIEHFREEGPFYWEKGLKGEDLAICCQSCNSSRSRKKLMDWFKTQFCIGKNINENTVATPVKEYIKNYEKI